MIFSVGDDMTIPRNLEDSFMLGCSGLAGLYKVISNSDAISVIEYALANQIIKFDTAPHYGLGLSEERIGEALHNISHIGKSIFIFTKVGRLIMNRNIESFQNRDIRIDNPNDCPSIEFPDTPPTRFSILDYTATGVAKAFDDSLNRLQHKIHGLRIHDCEDEMSIKEAIEYPGTSSGISELLRMRREGIINDISVGLNDSSTALRFINACSEDTFNSCMIAMSWNLLDHSETSLELLLTCQEKGIKVHLAGVFACGVLVGGHIYQYRNATPEVLEKVSAWKKLCKKYEVELPAVAMAFCMLPLVVECIAVGVQSVTELQMAIDWFKLAKNIPKTNIFNEAIEIGLLARHIALPVNPYNVV